MTNTLPANADINLLKKQAKKLLKQYLSGDADAIATVNTFYPKEKESFKNLRDAQLTVAQSYGIMGWAKLKEAIAETQSKTVTLYCDFCGRSQHDVRKLIAGPDVSICDSCTDLCIDIITEEMAEAREKPVSYDTPNLDSRYQESLIQKRQENDLPLKDSTLGKESTQGKDSAPESPSTTKNNSTEDTELAITKAYQNALDGGFSGVILVRHRGDIVLHEAAGFANKGQKILNTLDTVFDMGSITKQFTSALILSLQEAELLSVNDTLKEYLANVPEDKADITIHQLLTHTAGFREGFGPDTSAICRDDYIERAWELPLAFAPGSEFGYSNVGYSLAAAIAEIVTAQSYEATLRKHIFEPAKLFETGYRLPGWSDHTLAVGYRDGDRLEEMSSWDEDGPYWNLRGNGGLLTTVSDLLKWHDVLSGDGVLKTTSIEAMQARHVDQSFGSNEASDLEAYYGYGWVTQDTPSGVVHWHTGGNGYFYAFFGRMADEDSVVVGLANEGGEALDRLCKTLGTIMR